MSRSKIRGDCFQVRESLVDIFLRLPQNFYVWQSLREKLEGGVHGCLPGLGSFSHGSYSLHQKNLEIIQSASGKTYEKPSAREGKREREVNTSPFL